MSSPRVFISYARSDGEQAATALRRRLQAECPDLSLWHDRTSLEGGVGWWRQITDALDQVESCIMLLTPAAASSPIVHKEWRYARQQGVRVCPVLGPDAEPFDFSRLPGWMRRVHCYDLTHDWASFVGFLRTAPRETRVPFMAPDLRDDFVPRTAEYAALKATVLDATTLSPQAVTVALQGPGGFGKTTLASALCHDDEIITAFDDGVLWVTLGERPAIQQQLSRLYAALTGDRPAFVDAEDAAIELAARLEDKQCLIVLDDIWDANDVSLFLRGGRQCTRVVTTRRLQVASALGADRVVVNEMSGDEAVAMLLARLSDRPLDDGPFRRLARRLGEWPLLLRLAASQLRERVERGDSVQGALAFVNRALDKRGAVAFDRANPASRHDAVQSTVAASLALLNAQDRTRVTELAAFAESQAVPLSAAAALWGLDTFDAEETILRLDDASLVEFDLKRAVLRLHDVLRSHFLSQLTDARGVHQRLVAAWRDRARLSDAFAWRWYAWHLAQAGPPEPVRDLLIDPTWLTAKLHAADIHQLLSDFDVVPLSGPTAALRDALRLSISALSRDPGQLAAQLDGRLARGVSRDLDRLLEALTNAEPLPRLRLAQPTLTHPGQALVAILKGHSGSITAMDVSPDGHRLVTGASDRTLRIWDIRSWQMLRELAGHDGAVHAVRFLPDNRRLLSAGEDRTVRLWDSESGECLAVLRGHYESVRGLAVSPDGSAAASLAEDGTIRLWDLQRWHSILLRKSHFHQMAGLEYLRDGRRLVFGGGDGSVRTIDVNTKEEATLLDGTAVIRALALSPDGRLLLAGADDGTLRLCEVAAGVSARSFVGHRRGVSCVAFATDGSWAVSGGNDRVLNVWAFDAANPTETIDGHAAAVQAVAVIGSGQVLSASGDRTVRAWLPGMRATAADPSTHLRVAASVRWLLASGDGDRLLAVPQGQNAVAGDWRSGRRATLVGHTKEISAVWMADDGRRALTASLDRTVRLWDLQETATILELKGHLAPVTGVAMTPAGDRIVSLSLDRTIRVWDAVSGSVVRVLAGSRSERAVEALRALTVQFEETVSVRVDISALPIGRTTRMVMVPDGRRLVLGEGSWLAAWDLLTGETRIVELPGFQLEEMAVDGSVVVAGSLLGLVCRIDLDTGDVRYLAAVEGTPGDRILDVLVDAVSRRAIVADHSGRIVTWNFDTGQQVWSHPTPLGRVDAVALAPDGRFACAVTGDTLVAIGLGPQSHWERRLSFDHRITSVFVPRSGGGFTVGDESGGIHVVRLDWPAS